MAVALGVAVGVGVVVGVLRGVKVAVGLGVGVGVQVGITVGGKVGVAVGGKVGVAVGGAGLAEMVVTELVPGTVAASVGRISVIPVGQVAMESKTTPIKPAAMHRTIFSR